MFLFLEKKEIRKLGQIGLYTELLRIKDFKKSSPYLFTEFCDWIKRRLLLENSDIKIFWPEQTLYIANHMLLFTYLSKDASWLVNPNLHHDTYGKLSYQHSYFAIQMQFQFRKSPFHHSNTPKRMFVIFRQHSNNLYITHMNILVLGW